MKVKLKQLRVDRGLTQATLANAVGVSQPNYQRWEVGSAPIPEDKLKKLAKVLKTSAEAILGRHPSITAGLYDDSVDEDLNYYGEVSIQFHGGGAPLLLSISHGAFHRLYADLQRNLAFVTVESLANQTVVVRAKAIADLHFSSEAYDDCGPDGEVFVDYPDHLSIQMPDARDWEIVEALASDGDLEDFDPADVRRVTERIMITDEQYEKLVADGLIKPEDLEREREKNQKETDLIFDAAITTIYQLSCGKRRSVYVDEAEKLYLAFYELIDFDGGDPADGMIVLPAEGWDRTIFINKDALDYVMLPTHQYVEGRTEANAQELDVLEATAKQTRKSAKSHRRTRNAP
jgi:transcriptional regulator with XRE-family HTH domain